MVSLGVSKLLVSYNLLGSPSSHVLRLFCKGTYPFEFAKTRVQLYGHEGVRNPFAVVARVARQEGFTALYKGCSTMVVVCCFHVFWGEGLCWRLSVSILFYMPYSFFFLDNIPPFTWETSRTKEDAEGSRCDPLAGAGG